jgi:outer membrane usher protein FimD/PapC
MRKNKIKVKPFASGIIQKPGYDLSYGTSVSKGPLSVNVSQSKGTGYRPETEVSVSMSIPITRRIKQKGKKL